MVAPSPSNESVPRRGAAATSARPAQAGRRERVGPPAGPRRRRQRAPPPRPGSARQEGGDVARDERRRVVEATALELGGGLGREQRRGGGSEDERGLVLVELLGRGDGELDDRVLGAALLAAQAAHGARVPGRIDPGRERRLVLVDPGEAALGVARAGSPPASARILA